MANKSVPNFTVLSARPTVYTDAGGSPVKGFMVRFSLDDFNEIHQVETPTLDPATVKASILALATQRQALADLSTQPPASA